VPEGVKNIARKMCEPPPTEKQLHDVEVSLNELDARGVRRSTAQRQRRQWVSSRPASWRKNRRNVFRNHALLSVKLHLNGQTDKDVNPVFTRLTLMNYPHTMTPFLLRPNKSAQLLKITVALAKIAVSSSSYDVNSDILIS